MWHPRTVYILMIWTYSISSLMHNVMEALWTVKISLTQEQKKSLWEKFRSYHCYCSHALFWINSFKRSGLGDIMLKCLITVCPLGPCWLYPAARERRVLLNMREIQYTIIQPEVMAVWMDEILFSDVECSLKRSYDFLISISSPLRFTCNVFEVISGQS